MKLLIEAILKGCQGDYLLQGARAEQ